MTARLRLRFPKGLMTPEQRQAVEDAVRLHAQGWSITQVTTRFECADGELLQALLDDPGRWPSLEKCSRTRHGQDLQKALSAQLKSTFLMSTTSQHQPTMKAAR